MPLGDVMIRGPWTIRTPWGYNADGEEDRRGAMADRLAGEGVWKGSGRLCCRAWIRRSVARGRGVGNTNIICTPPISRMVLKLEGECIRELPVG